MRELHFPNVPSLLSLQSAIKFPNSPFKTYSFRPFPMGVKEERERERREREEREREERERERRERAFNPFHPSAHGQ